jgi:hypothetical protein
MEMWLSMWVLPNSVLSPHNGNFTRDFGEGSSIQVLKEDHWMFRAPLATSGIRISTRVRLNLATQSAPRLCTQGNKLGHQRRVLLT